LNEIAPPGQLNRYALSVLGGVNYDIAEIFQGACHEA
jgi:hypothetical protein